MNAPKADFDKYLAGIGFDPTPSQRQVLSELAADQSSWRKHPIRRFNAKRQDAQIALGEFLLARFPFLRPPAECLNRALGKSPPTQ